MLFSRKALGMEIYQDGAIFALLQGRRGGPQLLGYGKVDFTPETFKPSMKELNVVNPKDFVARIRDSYLKLLTPMRRVAVSLPDSAGRTFLLDIDVRFKNKEEGASIIRWKLKKNFPFDINELHLDYQILHERDGGITSVLTSCISRHVINQYEELLCDAGLEPNRIDFTTFNLCRPFTQRLELVENAAFVLFHKGTLSLLIFSHGVLEFVRSKELPGGLQDTGRIYREINNSIVVYNDNSSHESIAEVFCVATPEDMETLNAVVAEIFEVDPLILAVDRVLSSQNGSRVDRSTLASLTAAIGAATRNL